LLSKSFARAFFFGGTGLFSAVFVALSIDSMKQIPKLTHEDKLTDQVVRGKYIWEDNNCMGCHTLFGEGAYYAPELTKVVDRRGKPWMKLFLKDPEKMFPGGRKMVNYHFTDAQMDDVIAFFEWCGNVNLQGFPAKPPLRDLMRPTVTTASLGGRPMPELFKTICVACHSVGGGGGVVGPALDEVYKRKTRDEMLVWIANPQKIKPGTAMPEIAMSPEQRVELVDFLLSFASAPPPASTTPNPPAKPPVNYE